LLSHQISPTPDPGETSSPNRVADVHRDEGQATSPDSKKRLVVEHLNAWIGQHLILHNISIAFPEKSITALIGPSGCGKTTLLRCLNRLHEMTPKARLEGRVLLDGMNIYDPSVNPILIRRRIGMVFQKPNPFPTMTIFDNVAAGLRLNGIRRQSILSEVVERSLRDAALWDEVKDRLRQPATALSGGQQQRLCIARAIAVEPEIILFDEPCSALDPIATEKIEALLYRLKERYTIIIVTHNIPQAGRTSDYLGFLLFGELIEFGPTKKLLVAPQDERTEAYLMGRFG